MRRAELPRNSSFSAAFRWPLCLPGSGPAALGELQDCGRRRTALPGRRLRPGAALRRAGPAARHARVRRRARADRVHYYSLGLIAEAAGDLAGGAGTTPNGAHPREDLRPESPSVAEALENLGGVHIKIGRPDLAEPIFRRALKLKQDLIGRSCLAASGHSNLGDVALAGRLAGRACLLSRGDQAADRAGHLADRRQVDRRRRDQALSRHLRRALPRGLGDALQPAGVGALLEETFPAGQQAWNTSAASALAKMTARLGAGDTELGRRIRDVQDLSERILRLHADDQKLLTDWHGAAADPAYSAPGGVQGRQRRQQPGPAPHQAAAGAGPAVPALSTLSAGPEEGRLRGQERDRGRSPRSSASCRRRQARRRRDQGDPRRMEAAEKAAARVRRVHGAPHGAAHDIDRAERR